MCEECYISLGAAVAGLVVAIRGLIKIATMERRLKRGS